MNAKVLLISIAVIILLGIFSCKRQQPEVLATRIQYDVPVQNNDPQLDWWVNNLEGSKREPFLKRVIEAAKKGEVKTFDYFNNPMTPAQVTASLSDTVYQTFARNYPPYEEYDTMIIITTDYKDIQKIRFLEEWRWDPENMTMQKEILGFGPLIQKEVAGATFNQLLFWIMF